MFTPEIGADVKFRHIAGMNSNEPLGADDEGVDGAADKSAQLMEQTNRPSLQRNPANAKDEEGQSSTTSGPKSKADPKPKAGQAASKAASEEVHTHSHSHEST